MFQIRKCRETSHLFYCQTNQIKFRYGGGKLLRIELVSASTGMINHRDALERCEAARNLLRECSANDGFRQGRDGFDERPNYIRRPASIALDMKGG